MEQLGRHHPSVRRLRALRRERALRDRERVYLAEGFHLADEALACGVAVEQVLVSPRLTTSAEGRELRAHVDERRFRISEVSDALMDSLQDARSPQPILIIVRRTEPALADCLSTEVGRPLVVVSHGVQDPGNLGGMLRTADAAGADVFVSVGPAADPFHPRAVRGSMGSVFRLPPMQASAEELFGWLQDHKCHRVGTMPDAETPYTACDLKRAVALFFGGEGRGLPSEIVDRLDQLITIPLRPGVNSLSVTAAAAITLFEAARQRGQV